MKIGRVIGASVIVAIAIPTVIGIALTGHSANGNSGSAASGLSSPAPSGDSKLMRSGPCGEPAALPKHYIGFITARFPYNLREWSRLVVLTRVRPDIGVYYVPFGAPFNSGLACQVERMGVLPLLQIDLSHTSVAAIADGQYRDYLSHFAEAVKGMKARVAISVGHEMNGDWYPWGWHHVPAATFVRAWRVIHDSFTRIGAKNVIWVWTVNRDIATATNPDPWWPGASYVNWVGVDAHYVNPTDTFTAVFGNTIRAVRRVTSDPILVAETAIKPGPEQPRQLANLYQTTFTSSGLLGFVWFNRNSRFDWKLEGRAKTLAVFRLEARRYPA